MTIKKVLQKGSRRFRAGVSKVKGQMGEWGFESVMKTRGHKVERTGVGSDYKIGKKHYEIKTGSSRLTSRQRKLKRRLGKKRFEVVRY